MALIFDFDDTLVPDSSAYLLKKHGIDPETFWEKDIASMVADGFDPVLAYMQKLIELAEDGKPLSQCDNKRLHKLGSELDSTYFSGLPQFFGEIRTEVKNMSSDIDIEFYIVSANMKEYVEGSQIARDNFDRPIRAARISRRFGECTDGTTQEHKHLIGSGRDSHHVVVEIVIDERRRQADSNAAHWRETTGGSDWHRLGYGELSGPVAAGEGDSV